MSATTEQPRSPAAGEHPTGRWRIGILLAATLAVAALVHGVARRAPTPAGAPDGAPPNILLVSLDTTRADHCSAFGYGRPTTPRLDALLPDGVRFTAAYAPMPTTLPSHATLFTALHPRSHGVLKNGLELADGADTLARRLADAGYRTAGVTSSYVLDAKFGPSQGFADWDDDFGETPCKMLGRNWEGRDLDESFCRRGSDSRERATAWLERRGYLDRRDDGRPFFLFLHLFDPHNPYAPPPEHAALFPPAGADPRDAQIAAYDAEIHYADAQVGALLDRLAGAGLLDDTLVVVVGDHGEGLGQHGWENHGMMIYEEAVRVPLLVRWPRRIAGGRTIAAPVGLVDLAPTILDLAGAPGIPGAQGRSLAPALVAGVALDPEVPVVVQRRIYEVESLRGVRVRGAKVGVRMGRWKYIEAPAEGTRELYDLSDDPAELHDVATREPGELRRMRAQLEQWAARTPLARGIGRVDDGDAERLRALGYVQ